MRTTALVTLASFALGLIVGACSVPNRNHCFNLALDPNAWCAAVDEERPYCSPCVADNYGCVSEEPTIEDCPLYTTPAPATESGESGDESGTETGETTETETGESTETGETTETG